MTYNTEKEIAKPEKKKKKRCPICNKKITLMDYTCRCGNSYCIKHRMPEDHNCTFDYEKLGKDIIDKNNPQVVCEKVIKI